MSVRNLDFIRSLGAETGGDVSQEDSVHQLASRLNQLGARLYEALSDLDTQHATLAQQVNGNGAGQPQAPPPVQGIKVAAQNGHFQVSIQDGGAIYRGIQYYVEHADNPHFVNPHVVHLGDARNLHLFLGNVTRYFRAYSSYASSPRGTPAYFGGAQPTGVAGGGSVGGPDFLDSEGSGTGARLAGLSGPGPVPFRSDTGAAPTR